MEIIRNLLVEKIKEVHVVDSILEDYYIHQNRKKMKTKVLPEMITSVFIPRIKKETEIYNLGRMLFCIEKAELIGEFDEDTVQELIPKADRAELLIDDYENGIDVNTDDVIELRNDLLSYLHH